MDKRGLKKALKAFAIRLLWYQQPSVEAFEVANNIRTDRQKERVQEVILDIMREWN